MHAPDSIEHLRAQVEEMTRQQNDMAAHIGNMETDYQSMQSALATLKGDMTHQDELVQSVVQYFLQYENGGAAQ